jgi:hypothetical protein
MNSSSSPLSPPPNEQNINDSLSHSSEPPNYGWTKRIEKVLDMVRINCAILSDHHSYKYQQYKKQLTYFRIPIIVFSAINAFAAIGLQPYMNQHSISTMNSAISLFCGILTSVELFLNIQKKMESELSSHKDYYILSVQIFKVISMERSQRKMDGRAFLDSKFSEYEKLIQNSNVSTSESTNDIFSQPTLFLENHHSETNPHSILKTIPKSLYSGIHRMYNPKLHQIQLKKKAAIKSYESFLVDSSGNSVSEDVDFMVDYSQRDISPGGVDNLIVSTRSTSSSRPNQRNKYDKKKDNHLKQNIINSEKKNDKIEEVEEQDEIEEQDEENQTILEHKESEFDEEDKNEIFYAPMTMP